MATNLVSYMMQFLTPDMIERIASALGISRNNAQTGVTAAVPALLAAFSSAAETPGGAQSLVSTINQQSNVLDNFAGMLRGGNQGTFIENGSSLLTSLLGGRDQSALAGAIGKFSGLGHNAGNSLLGMLTPVVMGLIGKQIGPHNLDTSSLTGLLASQKDQIAHALPAGMGQLLGNTGILDSIGGVAGSAAAFAGQAGRAATVAASDVSRFASSTTHSVGAAGQRTARAAASTIPMWVYWAIPLVVAAGLAWYLIGGRTEHVAQQLPAPTQQVVVGNVDVGKQMGDSLGELRTALAGIADPASAQTALPKLEAASRRIDQVGSLVDQLSADQRKYVTGLVASAMPAINQSLDKALAIPGVSEVLGSTADGLRTKLADLSSELEDGRRRTLKHFFIQRRARFLPSCERRDQRAMLTPVSSTADQQEIQA